MNLEDLENNEPLGQRIFESVPKGARAKWGASLIKVLAPHIDDVPEEIIELLSIIEDGSSLSKTKEQFSKINDFSAANPDFKPSPFLMLAEGVAKVTYTETGLPEPFNARAGWYLALCMKRTADHINDPKLDEEITKLLTKYLKP